MPSTIFVADLLGLRLRRPAASRRSRARRRRPRPGPRRATGSAGRERDVHRDEPRELAASPARGRGRRSCSPAGARSRRRPRPRRPRAARRRATSMFSPSLRDELDPLLLELSTASAPSASTASSTCSANARNSSLFETGSVSQPTATIAPRVAFDAGERRRPSVVSRPARLPAGAMPRSRRSRCAASRSPPVSSSARLQSIIPAPVRSRSSLTRDWPGSSCSFGARASLPLVASAAAAGAGSGSAARAASAPPRRPAAARRLARRWPFGRPPSPRR